MVLDPTLRVLHVVPFAPDGSDAAVLFRYLDRLPPPDRFAGIEVQAPILYLPNVFEQEFCRHLIGLYQAHGGEESGFMRDVDGKTVMLQNPAHKRRRDYTIEDAELIRQTQIRVLRRIYPEILKSIPSKLPAWSATSSVATRPRTTRTFGRIGTTRPRAPPTAASPSPSTLTPNSRAAR
jgi:hypothetical protein